MSAETREETESVVLAQCVARMMRRPPVHRDRARAFVEYDGDKYGGFVKRNPQSFQELLAVEAANTHRQPHAIEWITLGDRFKSGPAGDHEGLQLALVMETLRKYPSPAYCELGCGFGRFLQAAKGALADAEIYGADFSPNGVKLARRFGLDAVEFDFRERDDYRLIRPGTTVFTVQAIEQLPTALDFLEGLRSVRENVERVVHIEPGPHPNRRGFLGHFRDAYTLWNDYNRDLISLLTHAPDIRVIEARYDVLGINPLNPVHVIVWEFVRGLHY